MKKPNVKYNIFKQDHFCYDGVWRSGPKEKIGTQYAVSPKQAVSRYKYNNGITPASLYCDYRCDDCRETEITAEVAS